MKKLSVFLKYILKISLDIVMADSGLLLLKDKVDKDFIISVIGNTAKSFSRKDRITLEKTVAEWIIQEHNEAFLLEEKDINSRQFNHLKESRRIK